MHCLKCYSTCDNFQHLSIGGFYKKKTQYTKQAQLHMRTTLARFKPLFELSDKDVNIVLQFKSSGERVP